VFAEGWAVYIEREVRRRRVRGRGDLAVDGDDYRITQRKLELRIATNALLDVGLHAGDLSDDGGDGAADRGAYQERREAEGKLARAKVTPGQLAAYFVGRRGAPQSEIAHALRHGRQYAAP
jgi:hypothetical protein